MPAKLDGTNGLLQQYDYQAPTTGFSYTFAAGVNVLVMQPAGTLATGTITMPAAPADGMTITFSSTRTITALTVNANTGQSIVSAPTVLPANQAGAYVYRLSNTTWYPYETVPTNVPVAPAGGSIITSGTALATNTSAVAYDFTALPSWVKRITVMFNGVSVNLSSIIQVQLGTGSTTYTTTGYLGGGWFANTTNTNVTTGIPVIASGAGASARTLYGTMTIANITGNTWVASSTIFDSNASGCLSGSSIALAAPLTAIRLTTVNGTDTFDAGTINILYE
jgi:hypothetical protein